MTYRWAGYHYAEVPDVWSLVRPYVQEALEYAHGEFTAEDILDALLRREAQLWALWAEEGITGAVITQVQHFPNFNVGLVFLASADDLSEALPFARAVLMPWAVEQGCRKLRTFCRPGLARLLSRDGWVKVYDVVEISIDNTH